MKRSLMFASLFAVIAISANAQKLKASKVPAAVKTAFSKLHPGTAVKWEKEDGKFEAGYKQDGHSMSSLFDTNGTLTETEMDIKTTDLPASVLAYVKVHYKGKKIKEGAKIIKADGTINYEAEVDGKDVIFDSKGNFLKEAKD